MTDRKAVAVKKKKWQKSKQWPLWHTVSTLAHTITIVSVCERARLSHEIEK